MADKKPILELNTESGTAKHHGLTMNDIAAAEQLFGEGHLSAAEIDQQYPGWKLASSEIKASLADLARAASVALEGPGQAIARMLKDLDLSRSILGDTLRQATEAATHVNDFIAVDPMTSSDFALRYRDPDEATYQVVKEVRTLAALAAATAESARLNAETAKASLDQTAALLTAVGSLHDTTGRGIAAGEARDVAAARREGVIMRLTWALVALTAVLAWPEIRQVWSDAEPLRGAAADWMRALAGR